MTSPPLKGLKQRREFQGFTQADMAPVIGATQSQFNKFENGTVRLDVHRAAKLAKHLGCFIDDLL